MHGQRVLYSGTGWNKRPGVLLEFDVLHLDDYAQERKGVWGMWIGGDKAKIGLIDVDGHNFPNLALMRISAYHKAHGDTTEWWWSDFVHYDIVYMSKIFSDTYTEDVPEPLNADRVIKGGTGYCIHLDDNGKERFDESKNTPLLPEIEHCFPDYSIYPQFSLQ